MLVSIACDVNIQLLIAEQLTRNKLIETKLNLCLYLCDYVVYHMVIPGDFSNTKTKTKCVTSRTIAL